MTAGNGYEIPNLTDFRPSCRTGPPSIRFGPQMNTKFHNQAAEATKGNSFVSDLGGLGGLVVNLSSFASMNLCVFPCDFLSRRDLAVLRIERSR